MISLLNYRTGLEHPYVLDRLMMDQKRIVSVTRKINYELSFFGRIFSSFKQSNLTSLLDEAIELYGMVHSLFEEKANEFKNNRDELKDYWNKRLSELERILDDKNETNGDDGDLQSRLTPNYLERIKAERKFLNSGFKEDRRENKYRAKNIERNLDDVRYIFGVVNSLYSAFSRSAERIGYNHEHLLSISSSLKSVIELKSTSRMLKNSLGAIRKVVIESYVAFRESIAEIEGVLKGINVAGIGRF